MVATKVKKEACIRRVDGCHYNRVWGSPVHGSTRRFWMGGSVAMKSKVRRRSWASSLRDV